MTDFEEGVAACFMATTLARRGVDADINRVDEYCETLEREVLRITSKPGISFADQATTRRLADVLIDRARKSGRVQAYSPKGA